MDFNDTAQEAAFRAEARAWLAANAPAFVIRDGEKLSDAEEVARGKAWQERLAVGGYAGILIPKSLGGRGGATMDAVVFSEEEGAYHLPKGPYIGIGLGMALPVINKHGTPDQIEKFAAPTLKGEITWCQLFSEPAAGSDLAGIRTRAVKDGDDWVVNGQKVWSSWAHHADWGILIVRTDPTVPKHKGMSFFVVDMKTPGIEVRPIRQISGLSDFNETFFTDVRIPDSCRIGAVGEGWACAMTVLMGERLNQGGQGKHGGIGALIAYAANTPRDGGTALDSAAVRVALAAAYAEEQAERHFQARLRTMVSRGENPGAMASIVKLAFTNRYQKTAGLALELRGPAGLAQPASDTETARIQYDYIWSTALRVAGGADEVLRNQISERILGMPGEIRTDKNVPFDRL
jgi:alkylation response protein AidB-like acyl-CoA dehydrogenase